VFNTEIIKNCNTL